MINCPQCQTENDDTQGPLSGYCKKCGSRLRPLGTAPPRPAANASGEEATRLAVGPSAGRGADWARTNVSTGSIPASDSARPPRSRSRLKLLAGCAARLCTVAAVSWLLAGNGTCVSPWSSRPACSARPWREPCWALYDTAFVASIDAARKFFLRCGSSWRLRSASG